MLRFTIRKLLDINSLEQVSAILTNHGVQREPYEHQRWPADEVLDRRFVGAVGTGTGIFTFEGPGNEQIRLIYMHAYSERAKKPGYWFDENDNLLSHDERVIVARANVLFFQQEQCVYCATQSQTAKTVEHLENELFLEQYWGGIVDATEYHVDDDFFYWLIQRWMRYDGAISDNLSVLGLSAYHGQSLEETHSLRGQGERVTELLGTMAFIFGNDPFRSLRLDIKCGPEYLSFSYDQKGSAVISEADYRGNFCGNTLDNERKALMSYYLYTRLVPTLIREYHEYRRTQWTPEIRHEFVRTVGMDILRRVALQLRLDPTMSLGFYLEE